MPASFEPTRLIDRLERGADAIGAAVSCVGDEDAKWKPDDASWSILEVVCHLADEDVEDFRTRTLMTLQSPDADWPPIDPEGWAIDRDYQSRDLQEQLDRFLSERAQSIRMLRSIENPDWTRTHSHQVFGGMSAGQMLTCWCAHDALHLRQLSRRMYQLVERYAPGLDIGYAGRW